MDISNASEGFAQGFVEWHEFNIAAHDIFMTPRNFAAPFIGQIFARLRN